MNIAWSFWITILIAIIGIFIWLWRYASKIEEAEQEELAWREWIEQMKYSDPYNAWQYDRMFEEKFMRK